MKNFVRKVLLLSVALVAVVACSCSRDTDNLLSTVPADSRLVAVIDFESMARKLAINIDNGKITFPADWQQALKQFDDDDFTRLAAVAEAVDITNVVVFGDVNESPVVTFLIRDAAKFEELVESVKPEKKSGFAIYNTGRERIVTRGNQGWIIDSPNPAELLNRLLDKADSKETGSIADITALCQRLDAEQPVRMLLKADIINKDYFEKWIAGEIHIDTQALAFSGQLIDNEGRVIETTGLQPLSTDFLRYTPANCNFVAAMGATKSTNWDIFKGVANLIPDPQLNGLLSTVMPFLEKADGTVALAADLNLDDPGASGATFLMMVHMPQAQVDEALLEIDSRLRSMGAEPTRSREGIIAVPGFYAGNVDGYLSVSSQPFSPTQNNSFTKYFLNRRASIVVDMPRIPFLDIPVGATINLVVQTNGGSVTIHTTTTVSRFIGQMLQMVI